MSGGCRVGVTTHRKKEANVATRRYGQPIRSVRVPDELWNAAKEKARTRTRGGKPAPETVSDVVVRALNRYVGPSKREHEEHREEAKVS